ncbi:hypothetical protein MMC24_006409, partial [Lignoscripta atroalba]|nr:hypothetical protein [Lignoscripta atroalba]
GEPIVPSIPATTYPHLKDFTPTLDDVSDMNVAELETMATFRQVLVENQLDGIVMPVYQATAVPHDTYGIPIYTVLANLLDYPSCAIPYGKAEKAIDLGFV